MENKMKKIFVLLTLFLCTLAVNTANAASLTAEVSRDKIVQGETFNLVLSYDGPQTNLQPDLTALNTDFNIFGVSSAYQHSNINGQISQKREWQVQLMPKKTGAITIPSVTLGKMKTSPLQVEVLEASPENMVRSDKNMQADSHNYAVDYELDTNSPYVQQEMNMTLKIYDTGGLQVERIAPMVVDENSWIIRPLGETTQESQVINGQNVRVIKVKLALFPQKSGKLQLPELAVDGYYLTKGNSPMQQIFADNFGNLRISALDDDWADIFASKNIVSLRTKPQTIDVLPIPQEYDAGWWVPAESVELFSEWRPNPPQFKVGEAVTRNIILKAVGVVDSQLPNIDFKENSNLQQYPEKPVNEMRVENGKIVSYRMISNVYIPTTAGQETVPEIKLKWFNTLTKQMQTVSLPALNIVVAPNPNMNASLVQDTAPTPSSKVAPINNKPQTPSQTDKQKAAHEQFKQDFPFWIILIAFGAGVIISYLVFAFIKAKKSYNQDEIQIKNFDKAVLKAAKNRQMKELRDNLILWGRNHFGHDAITNLNELADLAQDEAFRNILNDLSSALYAQNSSSWDLDKFVAVFERISKSKKKSQKHNDKPLPDLYK